MTRDQAIELVAFLGQVIAPHAYVAMLTDKDSARVQVGADEYTQADNFLFDSVATERGLQLDYEEIAGRVVVKFSSFPPTKETQPATQPAKPAPIRTGFADLTQDELNTCFETAFGTEQLNQVRQKGGVRTGHTCDESGHADSTYMWGMVGDYAIALTVWYGLGVQTQSDSANGIRPIAGDVVRLFQYLKSINVDFGF